MKIKKNKQIFIFDDDKNILEYDIEKDILNGTYNTLTSMDIDQAKEYFEDENMWFMFRDIGKKEKCNTIRDVIWNLYNYKNFEQIYSAGLKVYNIGNSERFEYERNDFDYTINEIPRGLRRICKENNMYLNNRMVQSYIQNPDIYNTVFLRKDQYRGLRKTNLKTITEYRMRGKGLLLTYLHDTYRYDITTLMEYFDYLKVDLKMRNIKDMLNQYSDYVKMTSFFDDKFEKYPKNFEESYKAAVNHWNQNNPRKQAIKEREERRKQREKEFFQNNVKHEYEIEYKDYIFIYPKSAEEIRKEGKNNHNCVATYIKDVMSRRCDILFLRKKDEPKKSLVTIEVRNGKIVQARRVCNSAITEEDREAVRYFNSIFSGKSDFTNNNAGFENLE